MQHFNQSIVLSDYLIKIKYGQSSFGVQMELQVKDNNYSVYLAFLIFLCQLHIDLSYFYFNGFVAFLLISVFDHLWVSGLMSFHFQHIYLILQTVAYLLMAVLLMRLKLFSTPALCLLTSFLASRKVIFVLSY